MKTCSAARMRRFDAETLEQSKITRYELLQRAGLSAARAVRDFADEFASTIRLKDKPRFTVLCGKGNNGGDGFEIAGHLFGWGYPVRIVTNATGDDLSSEAKIARERLPSALRDGMADDLSDGDLRADTIVVDALLGFGASGSLRAPYDAWSARVKRSLCAVVSIDAPSGLNVDSGVGLNAVEADLTLTFHRPKPGFFLHDGPRCCGRIRLLDIGLVSGDDPAGFDITCANDVRTLLGREPFDTYKNQRGHLMVLGGSLAYPSAPVLSAESALRSGAGLVTLGIPISSNPLCGVPKALILKRIKDSSHGTFSALSAVELLLEHENGSLRFDAFVLGPGMNATEEVREFLRPVLPLLRKTPGVLDADALNLIAQEPSLAEFLGPCHVLTPHMGEMRRLAIAFELPGPDATSPHDLARALAQRSGTVVVLKGCRSCLAAPDGRFSLNSTGCPALSTAGSGDVLSGVIGALLARGLPPFDAARAGVFLHGLCGELLAPFRADGILADDIVRALGTAFSAVRGLP